MIRASRIPLTVLLVASLASCAPGSDPDPAPSSPDEVEADSPCVVGAWQLDVPDYAAQAEAYLTGLGIPITEFAMSGDGTIEFTADGLVASAVDLTTTGTIVAGDASVPVNVRSAYLGSGDWSAGDADDTITLSNWSNTLDPGVSIDPTAPAIPTIDYTDIPLVAADCSADSLRLQAPDAPLSALWHR
ncbi:hypothetical protein BH10ACT7_BH10ACT7_19630 [soil metagenome]